MESKNKKESKKSWANTQIGLLVIGAVVSGILIPSFQYTQKFFEWRRENQYNNYSLDLQNKKLLLKKFIESTSYLAESHEILFDFTISKNKVSIDRVKLLKEIRGIQKKRFKINNEINYLIIETGNKTIEEQYFNFINLNQTYILKSKEIISELKTNSLPEKNFYELKTTLDDINESFDSIKSTITTSIQETINENKHFRLF